MYWGTQRPWCSNNKKYSSLPRCNSFSQNNLVMSQRGLSHYNVSISQSELKTNVSATVTFRFFKHPEVIFKDSKLLFRKGITRDIGTVTGVTPFVTDESACHNVTAVNCASACCNVTVITNQSTCRNGILAGDKSNDRLTSRGMVNSDSGYISQ